jgi:hypothetical protein
MKLSKKNDTRCYAEYGKKSPQRLDRKPAGRRLPVVVRPKPRFFACFTCFSAYVKEVCRVKPLLA